MKVLIAEDEAVSRHVLHNTLAKWNYQVIETNNGEMAWEVLSVPDPPHLAILDWMMPGLDGIELCRKIRAEQSYRPYTYIIILTGKNKKEDIVTGLEAGADDFVIKPFDQDVLHARMMVGRRILDLHKQLHHAATHDMLTGLYNRSAILETTQKAMARAERMKEPVSALLIDLDYFKNVNDTYGHIAGDQVLRQAAERMALSLRAYDFVGRYGGEEFLIIAPGATLDVAATLGERIRKRFEDEPLNAGEYPINVTISIGVADNQHPVHYSLERLVLEADQALYQSKDRGRNCVTRFQFE
ncbi:MAG: diguanylate cyclase [bacterium]|nr:diguanylate cyclase [bacterium]